MHFFFKEGYIAYNFDSPFSHIYFQAYFWVANGMVASVNDISLHFIKKWLKLLESW